MKDAHQGERTSLAVSLTLASSVFLAGMDACIKLLAQHYPVLMIGWARFGVMTLLLGAISVRAFGWRLFRPKRMGAQLGRVGAGTLATLSYYQALATLPLAECIAIAFLAPVLTAFIAARFLGERVKPATWVAIAGSLVGVLLIVRPGGALFGWAVLWPLGGAIGLALYQVTTRVVAQVEDARVSMFFSSIVTWGVFTLLLPFGYALPESGADLGLMVLVGVLGAVGQLILTIAFRHGTAALVSALGYSGILVGVVFGWLAFGHVPDALALLGMAIIASFGVLLVAKR